MMTPRIAASSTAFFSVLVISRVYSGLMISTPAVQDTSMASSFHLSNSSDCSRTRSCRSPSVSYTQPRAQSINTLLRRIVAVSRMSVTSRPSSPPKAGSAAARLLSSRDRLGLPARGAPTIIAHLPHAAAEAEVARAEVAQRRTTR